MKRPRKIVVGITGASGSIYARLLCQKLATVPHLEQIALIISHNGESVMQFEDRMDWAASERFIRYSNDDLFTPPASGSAAYDAMVIVPCSMGTLGRIAAGVSTDLIGRAADVILKERRRLILVPRETPLHTIHLQNMTTLSSCGAIICPASPSFYSQPTSIEEVCNTVVERIISLLGIELPHYEWMKQSDEPSQ